MRATMIISLNKRRNPRVDSGPVKNLATENIEIETWSPLKRGQEYVNTFACQNYLRKIVVLRISVSGRRTRICGAKLSYVNSFDTQMY